jgi:hypothetical protein
MRRNKFRVQKIQMSDDEIYIRVMDAAENERGRERDGEEEQEVLVEGDNGGDGGDGEGRGMMGLYISALEIRLRMTRLSLNLAPSGDSATPLNANSFYYGVLQTDRT